MSEMGIELELGVLLGGLLFGAEIFAPFEIETSAWRKIVKWSFVIGLTLVLTRFIGHWAAVVPVGLGFRRINATLTWFPIPWRASATERPCSLEGAMSCLQTMRTGTWSVPTT